MSYLLLLFLVPFISAIILLLLPRDAILTKRIAFALSLLPLAILLLNIHNWHEGHIFYPWLLSMSIDFFLQMDSLALLFVFLTAIIVPIAIISLPDRQFGAPNFFFSLVLLLQGLLIGFFTSQDLIVFIIFYEAMLLPIYFIIAVWGGPKREQAAMQFIVYMIAGSCLMLAAVLFIFLSGQDSFSISSLAANSESTPYAKWLCAAFLLAFAVKTPLFPFHAWLPLTYYEAPTAGTILLSALLSKAGIFGILRVVLELFPNTMQQWAPYLLGFAIAGVIYGALAAWRQSDYKKLIAYSSFSHVNFILAGIFAADPAATEGAVLQAINHGITITALFLVVGWLEERLGTTFMANAGGLASFYPKLCWFTFFFILSSIALPGTNNFIGEVLVLFGLFGRNPWLAALLGTTMILSAVYMLRWMQTMYFDNPHLPDKPKSDLSLRESAILVPLVILILWIGIYPFPVLEKSVSAGEKIVAFAQNRK